jgi:hypothetical protein
MDSYIVRVYRQEENNPRKLVGVVEEVGVKGKRAFTNVDDLWEILSSSKSVVRKRAVRGTPGPAEQRPRTSGHDVKGGDER